MLQKLPEPCTDEQNNYRNKKMATSDVTIGLTPDQYGQFHPIETQELIERKRLEFEEELKGVAHHARVTLNTAQERCPELLTDGFKLMFLRAELFNAKKAAKRYVKYWDKRLEVFGNDKAFLPLTLDGALKDDRVALSQGFVNVLPSASDGMGRGIGLVDPGKHEKSKYSKQSMARAAWYMLHVGLETRPEIQKHGIMLLIHSPPGTDRLSQFDPQLTRMLLSAMQGAIPMRLSALHICQPPAFLHLILPILKAFMAKHMQKRIHVHSGSLEQISDSLKSFGIEKWSIPEQVGGDVIMDMPAWLDERREAEATKVSQASYEPGDESFIFVNDWKCRNKVSKMKVKLDV